MLFYFGECAHAAPYVNATASFFFYFIVSTTIFGADVHIILCLASCSCLRKLAIYRHRDGISHLKNVYNYQYMHNC